MTLRDFNEGVEERKERAEEEESRLQKIACPDLCSVIVQEGPPVLSPWSRRTHAPQVFLDRAFAHANIQFQ